MFETQFVLLSSNLFLYEIVTFTILVYSEGVLLYQIMHS
jgi:hypothetical protein